MSQEQAVILSARRTPIGRFGGSLVRVEAPRLGSFAIEAAMTDAGVSPEQFDECIMGCVLQAGLGQNPARQAAIGAGLPDTITAVTINKVCGSGLEAMMMAARAIKAGDSRCVIAGGFENMNRAPHMAHVRAGVKYGPTDLLDHMASDGLTCAFEQWPMGCAAEHIASTHDISRQQQDEFSVMSHQRAAAATENGWFKDEIVPLAAEQIKQKQPLEADEGFRADSSVESLGKLRPAFQKDGSVTAGNASQISDGAAAAVIASESMASELGATPMARIVDYNTVGVEPKELFWAPKLGVEKILADNDLTVDDIDLFEINEAFAAQVLSNVLPLQIPMDKLNTCGGGIALGHPIGASGARVLTTLVHQLARTGGHRGICSLCLGGGNAVTMLVQRP